MLGLAAIVLVANVAYSAYIVAFTNGQALESTRNYTISADDRFVILLRIGITIGLLVCAAALAFAQIIWLCCFNARNHWLVLVYGWWQRESVAFLRNLEVADYGSLPDLSHAAGLRGATWWDLLVLNSPSNFSAPSSLSSLPHLQPVAKEISLLLAKPSRDTFNLNDTASAVI